MRIAFLCGTLAPGRDGVGDYVRILAARLADRGHECLAIALADRFVAGMHPVFESDAVVRTCRIPEASWNCGDTTAAESALREFAPDWVSLQMVSYSYEARGVLRKSAQRFARLQPFGRHHLMLHETWIGESVGSPLKERLMGTLQRHFLVNVANNWAPEVTHTSNPVYRELLSRSGIAAAELPLPGNIPVMEIPRSSARDQLISRLGPTPDTHPRSLLAGFFGAFHPECDRGPWLKELNAVCVRDARPLVLIHVGRMGEAGKRVWSSLASRYAGRIAFHALGELPVAEVSRLLQGMDLGIATTPWALAGKSGAVAAMIEHGLPVLVPRDDFSLRSGHTPEPAGHPLLHPWRDVDGLAQVLASTSAARSASPALDPGSLFLASLSAADRSASVPAD